MSDDQEPLDELTWGEGVVDRGGIPRLNTTVNGSLGTCFEAADELDTTKVQAETAGDQFHGGLGDAASGWEGPAYEAFRDANEGVGGNIDQLEHSAATCGRALREFGHALEKVIERMDDARGTAAAGGLEIDGPFILPPETPGPEPELPGPPVSPNQSTDTYQRFSQEIDAYDNRVAEYNRKADVFEECQELHKDARNREDEAHDNLQQAFSGAAGWGLDLWSFGTTTASAILSGMAGVENERQATLARLDNLRATSGTYQKFATGQLTDLTDKERQRLNQSAAKAGPGEKALTQRIKEFESYTEKVPENVRNGVAGYPGKSMHPPGTTKAASVLKGLPYAASGVVLYSELRNAATGEQTWTQAAARSGAQLGGGSLGAAAVNLGARAVGVPLGPVGTFLTVSGGTALGSIGTDHIIDFFTPDPNEKYYPDLPRHTPMSDNSNSGPR